MKLIKPQELNTVVTLTCFWRAVQQYPKAYIWFNDEAHFDLNGYMNKQNICVWASEHHHNKMETPLHPEKCMLWCTLSTSWAIFFGDTVTAGHYLHVPQEECLPFLKGMCVSFRWTFFQQDRALPHTSNLMLNVLSEHFDNRVLSYHFPEQLGYGWSWPPYSLGRF
jgi:hypothetical protein